MRSRPLCLFLCFLVLLSSFFVVPVGAVDSSRNLLSPDITEWRHSSTAIISSYNSGIFRVFVQSSDFGEVFDDDGRTGYGVWEVPELISGHTYTSSLRFPSVSEINSALNTSFSQAEIIGHLNSSDIKIFFGIAYINGSTIKLPDEFMFKCLGSDFGNYLGKTITFDFTYSTLVNEGTPSFVIGLMQPNSDTSNKWIYVSNPVLIDNDADNSSSLFANLLEFLKDKFDSISSSFSSLGSAITSKLETVKNAFNSAISSLGDSLSSALTGLGNLLLYFDWEGDYKNPFEDDNSPISLIYERLLQIDTFIKDSANSINSAVDSITGVITLFDDFVSEFDWLFMLVTLSLVLIVFTRFIGL